MKKHELSLATRARWWFDAKALYCFASLVESCPERFLPRLAAGLGTLSFYLLSGRRATALRNLELVWGSTTSAEERRGLVKALFKNISRDLLEVVRLNGNPERLGELPIKVHGREHLDKAVEKGNGVIAVSAHVGNFPLIGARLVSLGYPFWLIYKIPKNHLSAAVFKEWMDRAGVGVIPYKPRRVCAQESLKILRKKGIVLLFIDQNPRERYGMYVDFFGYSLPTYNGPVVLAQRSGAALVPMYMHRESDGSQILTILPELSITQSDSRTESLIVNLENINRLYERWISAYPDQWWWIHRRFRRRHGERRSPFAVDCSPRKNGKW
ncbi:MAG TPA: hypothetical protein PKJ77_10720 [Thermodesulfobacteriota bacterium]|nr:hypothetical protein [Thermodesulfobacteriota bacterium]